MRLLATITIQPHIAKNKKITPEKLLPFPWDKQKGKRANAKAKDITPAQQRKRMEELVKKLGDSL